MNKLSRLLEICNGAGYEVMPDGKIFSNSNWRGYGRRELVEHRMQENPDGMIEIDSFEKIINDIAQALRSQGLPRKLELESLIAGHMEAMRPLLEEWSKLNENAK